MTPGTDDPTASEAPRRGSTLRSLLILALLAWVLRSFVIAPFSIPSGSMLPTMMIGDYLFVQKWPYGYSRYSFPLQIPSFDGRVLTGLPKRGDIVVFRPPGQENLDFVKRVIGLPGDRVAVAGGTLILNGRPVAKQSAGIAAIPVSPNSPCRVVPGATPMLGAGGDGAPVCRVPAYRETLPGGRSYLVLDQVETSPADDFAEITVPAGHVFLMGDNRDDSLDSRFAPFQGGVGFVPLENLVGRASLRFWSTDGGASWIKPWTWVTALRGERIGSGYQ